MKICRTYGALIIRTIETQGLHPVLIYVTPSGFTNKITTMSQFLSKMYVHLVFSTKGRTDTIPKMHLNDVYAYIAEILNQHHSPAIKIGGTFNHIHILLILNKSMSLSEIVRIVKANSSKWINEKNSKLNPFYWQDGYGAFSISQSHVEDVKHYIENQAEHHSRVDFKDEFRRLCNIYAVEFDEKYVWD